MKPTIFETLLNQDVSGGQRIISIGAIEKFVADNIMANRRERIHRQYDFVAGDATEIAADFDVTKATVAVSANTITCTTGGSSGTDDAGVLSKAACFLRADEPGVETKVKLSSIANAKYEFGFYVDSNNFCLVTFDPTATIATKFFLNLKVSGTAQTMDLGVAPVAATYNKIAVILDTAGKPYVVIDDDYIPLADSVTNRMPATAAKMYSVVTEQAAAAKVATNKYFEYSYSK